MASKKQTKKETKKPAPEPEPVAVPLPPTPKKVSTPPKPLKVVDRQKIAQMVMARRANSGPAATTTALKEVLAELGITEAEYRNR
jgi:hypothetical protein